MRLVRSGTVLWIGALALAVYACETSRRIGGVQSDTQSPFITLTNTAGDTQDIAGGQGIDSELRVVFDRLRAKRTVVLCAGDDIQTHVTR